MHFIEQKLYLIVKKSFATTCDLWMNSKELGRIYQHKAFKTNIEKAQYKNNI